MRRSTPHTASSAIPIPSARALLTTTAVAAMGLALAACNTTSQYAPREGYNPGPAREPVRPNFPIAPTQPQAPPPAYTPPVSTAPPTSQSPSAAPSGAVSSQALPPVSQQASPPVSQQAAPGYAPTYAPTAQPGYQSPPPAYAPPPVPRTTTTTTTVTSVSGRVVDVAGKPQVYTIKSGDTLTSISKRMDLTQKELADLNDLEPPYALRAGRTLKGPATKSKAYVVGQGDTIFAISRRFNVTAAALAEENDLRTSSSIRAGQRLTLPKGYKDSGPVKRTVTNTVPVPAGETPAYTPAPTYPSTSVTTTPATPSRPAATTVTTTTPPTPTRPATTTTTTTTTAPPRPGVPPVTTTTTTVRPATPLPATSLPVDAPALSDSEIANAGRGRFAWPVRGSVISSYGPTGTGQRNDGLNIRGSAGDPVRAAAAGEVVYAGDQVPGFGNLVLVKHDGGWVTAYAHLQRADVKMRQQVAQGQQIGQIGSTGGVPEAQLHFEVRYAPTAKDKARPIDPALVLPR